jgi:hypothetical protein
MRDHARAGARGRPRRACRPARLARPGAREPALVATAFSALAAPLAALALLVGVGQPLRDARWLPAVALLALAALPVLLGLTAVVWGRPLALLAASAISTVLALPLASPPTALLLALLVPAALYGVAYVRWQPRPALAPADALRLVLPLLLAAGALFVLSFVPTGREVSPLDALAQAGTDGTGTPSPQDMFGNFTNALSSSLSMTCSGIPKCGRLATSSQVGIAGLLIVLAAAAGWLLPRARAAGPADTVPPAASAPEDRQIFDGQDGDPRPNNGTAQW